MTDPSPTLRWDTLPAEPAPRPTPEAPSARDSHAAQPADTAASPAGVPPASPTPRSGFDHDAPTAKLPAVPKQAPRKRAPVSKPGPFPVIAGSAGLFFAIAAFLAFQMRAGADPALGAGKPVAVAQAAAPAPRQVLVRRVIVTRIVEHRPRRVEGGAAPAASGITGAAPAPNAPSGAAPAPSASSGAAPAPSAPSAPAPAPAAPAPAPAPLTTQSS